MSTTSFALRGPMSPLSRRVRAYFAPVERATETPTIFAPGLAGAFALDSPPAPWLDLGWIENFRRSSATKHEPLRSGPRSAPVAQFRAELEARVECDFCQWGKLQMALAAGSEHMNVLAEDPNNPPSPSGGPALPPVSVLPGSTASEIVVGVGVVDQFAAGDLVAVDSDYNGETGYIGSGVPGSYIKDPADVMLDRDYVRRVTFNVERIASKTANALILAQPLLGGAPPADSGAQKVVAFVDREGGSFFQEWSALFVLADESGGRLCYHYPRLQAAAPSAEGLLEIAPPLASTTLHAAFRALPYTDANDSEQVVCYRSYFPAPASACY